MKKREFFLKIFLFFASLIMSSCVSLKSFEETEQERYYREQSWRDYYNSPNDGYNEILSFKPLFEVYPSK